MHRVAALPTELMSEPSYSTVVQHLAKAFVPFRQLTGDGCVAVTLAGGRVVAMGFSPDSPNLMWSNPKLHDTQLVARSPENLVGGFGGERLWFGPEVDYHWDGVPDWKTFANSRIPLASDPGAYQFVKGNSRSITLCTSGELRAHSADRRVAFEVSRTIRLVEPPLPKSHALMRDIEYVGIESSHVLKVTDGNGVIDLWHVLQVPVGSVFIAPLKKQVNHERAVALSYGLPGEWVESSDRILWRYVGDSKSKCGLPAAALTGRSAVVRELQDGRWSAVIREFPVDPTARYCDHPYGVPRNDQVLQAWDGYGFGEMEFHSPAADAVQGPRELKETDRLWTFAGQPKAIQALATQLLGIEVDDLFSRLSI
jgi:hypothetical protein